MLHILDILINQNIYIMKQFLLKTWLTMLCLLVGVGTSWAETVTVTLKDGGSSSDGTSKIANSGATIDAEKYTVSATDFVNSVVAGNACVFQAQSDCGWKFGNSSNAGKITINLKESVEIASVKVTAKNASSKVADLKIGGGTAQALTADFADYTQNYTSGNSTNSIVIETALHTSGDRRAYITSIVITTADGGSGDNTPVSLSVPSNLASSNVTTTGATLSWDAVSNASSYTVKIGETEHTGVNTNSYSATGLTAGTQYTWTVKAVGDGTDYTTSAYAANATFTTEAEPDVIEAGTYNIKVNNKLFGTSYNGTVSDATIVSGTKNGVTVTFNKGTSTSYYINDSEIRTYGGTNVVVSAPEGYMLTNITWVSGSFSASVGNLKNDVWEGEAESVIFTHTGSAGQSRISVSEITVTYVTIPTNPIISASDVTINADATDGEIPYTIKNSITGVNPTASITSGDWISNVAVDAVNSKITFSATENTARAERTATITVSYTDATDKVVTITQNGGALTEIVDVTGEMTWDFSGYTKDVTTDPATEVILGNYVTLTTGDADALKGKQQYIVRNNYCWQGTQLTFHPTVAGTVEVLWSSTSGSNYRTLKINDGDYAVAEGSNSTSANGGVTTKADVPANQDVVLTGWNYKDGEYTSNQIRIWRIVFTPVAPTPAGGTLNFVATTGDGKYYATFSSDRAIKFDEAFINDDESCAAAIKAYAIAIVGGEIYRTDQYEVNNDANYTYIPANTGILFEYTLEDGTFDGAVPFEYADAEAAYLNNVEDNMLVPCAETAIFRADADGNYYYKLAYGDNTNKTKLGFWWGAEDGSGNFKVKAGGAVLCVPQSAGAKLSGFVFGDEDANSINNIPVLDKKATIYNLNGQRVSANAKGIVIVNGKKMLNK